MNKIPFLFAAILLSVNLPALSYSRINANVPLTYVSSFVGDDLGVTGIVSPAASATPLCYSNAETVTATIKNFGAATIDFSLTPAVITLKVTGTLTQTLTNSPTGTLAAGASMNVTFAPAINMSVLGPYNFSIYSSLPGDVDLNNDTLPLQTRICGLTAGTVTTSTPSFCGSGSPVLTYSNTTQSIQWEKATAAAGPWSSATASTNYSVTMPSISVKTYYRVKLTCNGNLIYSNSVSVDVFAAPVVTVALTQGGSPPPGPVHYCLGMNILLYSTSSVPAASYQWYKNGSPQSGLTGNGMVISSYTGFTSGLYQVSVMVTTANGCTAMSNVITVAVVQVFMAPSSGKVCQGSSVQLSVPSSLSPFQWQRNGVFIPGAVSNIYFATQSGTYTIWPFDVCASYSVPNYPFIVTVDSIPVSTITPSATQNICSGQSVLLTANTATGLTYQWKKDGVNITGATGLTYTATSAGNYTVASTNTCGTVTSAATTVAVNAQPPAVITPQGPTNYCNGDSVVLTANTDTGLTYQWRLNNSAIAGATNSSYTVKNTAGNYSVVVTNTSGCSTISNAIPIIVNFPSASINAMGPTTFCSGGTVKLQGNTIGAGITYQWQLNNVNIPGANGLAYTAILPGNYTVIQTFPCYSVTSAPVTVTVNPIPFTTVTPAGPVMLCAGSSIVLNADTGTGLPYQWQRNGINITGATNASYTADSTGIYSVLETSSAGCTAVSSNVFVAIGQKVLVLQPDGVTGKDAIVSNGIPSAGGSDSAFAVSAKSGTNFFEIRSYIQFDLSAVPANAIISTAHLSLYAIDAWSSWGQHYWDTYGNTTVSLQRVTSPWDESTVTWSNQPASTGLNQVLLPFPTKPNQDYLYINVTAIMQDMYANPSTNFGLRYLLSSGLYAERLIFCSSDYPDPLKRPRLAIFYSIPADTAIITPAGATSVCSGNSVVLNANTGTGLTYQWKKSGNNIAGASGSTYNATTTGSYSVAVTGVCNTVTSAATTVTINPLPTATISPAGPTTFCNGGSVILNAPVNANYIYQWKKSGANISGATSSSYTATAIGTYKVSVTNSVTGCSKTTPTAISVTKITPVASITPQGPTTFCNGGSVVLQANTGTGFTYKWKKGSNYISGATASTYTATKAGTYKAEVTDGNGCSKISAGIVVTVPCREGEIIAVTSNEISATLFPNPYSESFTLLIDGDENDLFQVSIKDVLGRTIEAEKSINAGSEISLGEKLSPGFYLVEIVSGDKLKMLRVEKMQ